MNIPAVRPVNFRSWSDPGWIEIPRGTLLLSGRNGAGKTTLIDGMLFALYGIGSDAGSLIQRGCDQASFSVRLETEQGDFTIERSIRRKGTAAPVGLKLWSGDEDLSAATVGETQKLIAAMIPSEAVLRASAFSTQHGGAAFTEAAPRERKRIFGEILTLGMWDALADEARTDLRDAKGRAQLAQALVEQHDGAGERLLRAQEAEFAAHAQKKGSAEDERNAEAEATRLAAEAEAAREARRQHAAAVEQAERARADHEYAMTQRVDADQALARAKSAAANAPDLERAQQEAHEADTQLAEIEAEQSERRETSAKWREQFAEAERELRVCGEGRDDVALRMMRLRERLATASGDVCPECHQDLVTPEAKAIVGRMRQDLADATDQLASCDQGVATWHTRIEYLKANAGIAPDDAKLRIFQSRSQQAHAAVARAETTASLAGSIDAAQQRARDAMDREGQTAEALREAGAHLAESTEHGPMDDFAEPKHQAALTALAEARTAHREAAASLARAEAAAQQAERDAQAEAFARSALAEAQGDAAVAEQLVNGFGPQGVPALVIDNVLGQLVDEGNRVLSELGTPIRVDLRSQRVTQKGDLVDALDIIVMDGVNEASYETLSGGERTRVALALRAALTRLLAAKSGARVRLLVADEPQGLDAAGAEAFADVLQAFVAASIFDTCIVVTHDERLADRIDRVIRVEKTPGGESRLAESASPGSNGAPTTAQGVSSGQAPAPRAEAGATHA